MSEHGRLFDDVAEAYDRFRPGYPAALIDEACSIGDLATGSRVLDIGCGTGKLTALAERGLVVEDVDPGPRMVHIARRYVPMGKVPRRQLRGRGACIRRVRRRILGEGLSLGGTGGGWSKAARVLRPGGLLALLWYINGHGARRGAPRRVAGGAAGGRRLAFPRRPDHVGGRAAAGQRLGALVVAREPRSGEARQSGAPVHRRPPEQAAGRGRGEHRGGDRPRAHHDRLDRLRCAWTASAGASSSAASPTRSRRGVARIARRTSRRSSPRGPLARRGRTSVFPRVDG